MHQNQSSPPVGPHQTDPEIERYLINALSYDPDTGEFFWKIKPSKNIAKGSKAGGVDKLGYVRLQYTYKGVARKMYLHRLAWRIYYGEWPDLVIDHINRDRSDNRLCNLRVVTVRDNVRNARPKSGKYSGVHFDSLRSKWVAKVRVDGGKRIFLGRFPCPTLAAIAYDKASSEYHGDFGYRKFL